MNVGLPVIVIVFATASVAKPKPPGRFIKRIPVADPPYLKVIGAIPSPAQTVCSPNGAVVCTYVG